MNKNSAPAIQNSSSEKLKKFQEEESKMVRGIFRFHECPGGSTSFPLKKYPNEEIKIYHFTDGEEYTVPLWVARWLNGIDVTAQAIKGKINSCGYPIHQHGIDRVSGLPLVHIGQVRRRMGFESTEFVAA